MASKIIQSPGVEIRESDLSLRAPANVGTNMYVTGFAQQGPIDEVLNITSKQELLQIFGPPTNSAERYFHFTINQLLNSPATVYAGRLPYGDGAGDGFGSKYSALAYPVTAIAGSSTTTVVSTYTITQNYGAEARSAALSGAGIEIIDSDAEKITINFAVNGSGPVRGDDVKDTGDFASSRTITVPISTSYAHNDNTLAKIATRITTQFNLSANAIASFNAIADVNATTGVKFTLSAFTTSSTFAGAVSASTVPGLDDPGDIFSISNNSQLSSVGGSAASGIQDTLSQSGSAVYVLGEPVHITLTESEFLQSVDGSGFDWSATDTAAANITNYASLGNAGVVILNKAQVTNNQQNEGYYVGLVDNTSAKVGNSFISLTAAKSITSNASRTPSTDLTDLPHNTLTFQMSAAANEGPTNSMSRVNENLTEYDLDSRTYDDYLSVGVFKLRKSVFATEATKLDYVLTDQAVGSINAHRQRLNPDSGPNVTAYLGREFSQSRNVKVLVNDYISNRLAGGDALNDDGTPKKRVRIAGNTLVAQGTEATVGFDTSTLLATAQTAMGSSDANNLYPLGAYTDQTVTDKVLGSIPTKLERALDSVKNDEIYDIDVVVEGGLGTIHSVACAAGTSYYDEFSYNSAIATAVNDLRTSDDISGTALTMRNNYMAIFNKFDLFVKPPNPDGGSRGDCIFIADPIRQIYIKGEDTKVLDDSTLNFQLAVYWATKHQFENANTSYACTYGSWAKINDDFSGQNVWVPFSAYAAAAMARTDAATFPWFAPAGFSRGLVTDALDIAVNPNQKQRDEFYKANINPVAFFPAQGQVIFGQKTLQKKPSAFDRINVRRLFLALERPTKKVSRFFVFEQNTEFTRTRIVNTLTPLFERAKNNEGLYDYLIVCDERNNTPAVIDANELVVDIYIKPTRTAEFILVNFYATRTDANFQELVGG